jgi:hypothetical protein
MKRCWIRFLAALPLGTTTVLIEDCRAKTTRGAAPPGLLAELSELARSNGVACACLHARKTVGGFSLALRGIPRQLHQRFRNVWGANWR